MLSREVMGVLALAILWVNTLLIAAAAWKARSALLSMRSSWTRVVHGKVTRGDGPDGTLATFEVKQLGRLASGPAGAILFHDKAYAGSLSGGCVALDDGTEAILSPSENAEVWVDDPSFREFASPPSEAAFDAALVDARKARGFSRAVRAPIGAGQELFVAMGKDGEPSVVSTLDPDAWTGKRTSLALVFIATEIMVAAACTALVLHRPLFGTLSTVGGAASLAFFLLVQPLGTWLRDTLRPPSRAQRRGTWTRNPSPRTNRA
jgi:hypothetical protein